MASTRKPTRARSTVRDLLPRLRARLDGIVPRGSRVVVALSGGVDSIVLLDLLRRMAARGRLRLSALHVNHQLQSHAGDWATFCRRFCRASGIPLRVVKVDVASGASVEHAARLARYRALLARPADFVALAHNQDDQAETLLLHLFRGSGIRGLAGMRVVSGPPLPVSASNPVRMLRPLLDVPREAIARYAAQRKLEWIEDPTNTSSRFTRNFLRAEVLPRVAERFPSYRDALARAARHAAEAVELLDDVARRDIPAGNEHALGVAALRALAPLRAKNALSRFLRDHGVEIPSAERLDEVVRQVLTARADARICADLGAAQLRLHRGALVVVPDGMRDVRPVDRVWRGEGKVELPELGGTLVMTLARGGGLSAARLGGAPVTIRTRKGGERLRPRAAGATRTVKNLMQEARMPAWQRDRIPFIYCGDELVCVPGLAMASGFLGKAHEPCIMPVWRAGRISPHSPRR